MLSLGSNISATQAVESKYSGVFDGTDDFIDCGLIDFNTDDISVSCWIKVREWTEYSCIWSNRDTSSPNVGYQLRTTGTTGELRFFCDFGGSTDPVDLTGVPTDTWCHIVCTVDRDGNIVIYLNHDEETDTRSVADQSSVDVTTVTEFRIARSHSTLYHNMSINQLGIWNVALSANAVEALYNNGKPINLRINQGNYTSSSNLQQYYKFGNGSFDDKANGIVHDQDNPGFGSNLVVNADFSANEAEDQNYLNGGLQFDNWVEQQSTGLRKFELTSDGQGIRCTIETANDNSWNQRIYQDVSSVLTVGDVYEFSVDVLCSLARNFEACIETLGGVGDQFTPDDVALSANTRTVIKKVFRCTATSDSGNPMTFHLYPTGDVLPAGEFYEVRNPSLKKLNGNPGVTSGGVTFSSDTP